MNTEWIDLPTGKEVFDSQAEGWEIEQNTKEGWKPWSGTDWCCTWVFRGRPAQPKKRIVTSECWRHKITGALCWQGEDTGVDARCWQRFPAGDITGEVEE